MGKRNNSIIISGILVAFLVGTIVSSPSASAANPVITLINEQVITKLNQIIDAIAALSTGVSATTETQIDDIETETNKIQMVKDDVTAIKTKTGSIFSDRVASTATNPFSRPVPGVDGERFVINVSAICRFSGADPANTAEVRINDGVALFSSPLKFSEQDNLATVAVVTGFVSGVDRAGTGLDDRTYNVRCTPGGGATFQTSSSVAMGWTP